MYRIRTEGKTTRVDFKVDGRVMLRPRGRDLIIIRRNDLARVTVTKTDAKVALQWIHTTDLAGLDTIWRHPFQPQHEKYCNEIFDSIVHGIHNVVWVENNDGTWAELK